MRFNPFTLICVNGLILVSLAGINECHDRTNRPPSKATRHEMPRITVEIYPSGKTLRLQVELARTAEDRSSGLMFRKDLAATSGMLFVFPREELQSFWMKNTYLPLDMIFIDSNKKIVGVIANTQPLTTHPLRVTRPSRYVLEVNGGFCQKHAITEGTPLAFDQP